MSYVSESNGAPMGERARALQIIAYYCKPPHYGNAREGAKARGSRTIAQERAETRGNAREHAGTRKKTREGEGA